MSDRFRFRLQPLLDRATRCETAARRELAAASHAEAQARAALAEVASAPASMRRLLDVACAEWNDRRRARGADVARLRDNLIEQTRRRRALELLRERQRARFLLERERAAEGELGEMNASAAGAYAAW